MNPHAPACGFLFACTHPGLGACVRVAATPNAWITHMAIVFIPGIKGSELIDSYPLDWRTRWSLEDMVVGNIFENPMDLALTGGRYDAVEGHWLRPGEVIRYAYSRLVSKLRAWQQPQPLYVHTYDWRKPLELSAQHLVRMLEEIQGREQAAGRSAQLSFVTHSMGGLLLRSALGLRDRKNPFRDVDRVVFIAPPFRGAIGAPYALVVGERNGLFSADEDQRRLARTFPSVYQMTPSWPAAALASDGSPLDLFDPQHWQANVRDGKEFQPGFLTEAEAFVRGKAASHGGLSSAPLLGDRVLATHAQRILVLCGAGHPTPQQLPVQTDNTQNPNWFDFAHATHTREGDGTVPLISAAVKGVTLAAFDNVAEHALLCREERVVNLVSLWLEGKKALKMTRRGPQDPAVRRGRRYFQPWDGDPASFEDHIA
jgi:hypothetical protein